MGVSGLCWRSPPGRREKPFTSWADSGSWPWERRAAPGSRCHQTNVDTAILSPAFRCLIGLDRLILTDADQVNLVSRDIVLRREILNHRTGAALAQIIVVIGGTDRVRSAFQGHDVTLRVGNFRGQFV